MKNLDRYRPRINRELHIFMRFIAVIFIAVFLLGVALALLGGYGLVGLIVIVVFFLGFWATPGSGPR